MKRVVTKSLIASLLASLFLAGPGLVAATESGKETKPVPSASAKRHGRRHSAAPTRAHQSPKAKPAPEPAGK